MRAPIELSGTPQRLLSIHYGIFLSLESIWCISRTSKRGAKHMQWKIVGESHNSLTHIFREFQRIIIVLDLAQVEPRIKWQLASWRNHAKKKLGYGGLWLHGGKKWACRQISPTAGIENYLSTEVRRAIPFDSFAYSRIASRCGSSVEIASSYGMTVLAPAPSFHTRSHAPF